MSLPLCLAAETYHIGFCPTDPAESETTFHGSGKTNDIEVMIRLSPSEMTHIAAVKGSAIMGVRFKSRCNVERKGLIQARTGSLDEDNAASKECWIKEGWNEVSFPSPIVIGDEDIYIGYRVNENQGSGHHPVVASTLPSPADTYFINIGLTGWQEQGQHGAPLVEAIVDSPEGSLALPGAICTVYDTPRIISPNSEFEGKIAVKNMSSEPIESLRLQNGWWSLDIDDCDIPAFGTLAVPVTLLSGPETGSSVAYTVDATKINGQDAESAYRSVARLFVTEEMFRRIPLIEEFTGLTCQSCPFMAYYLEQAREEFGEPHTYVAHHAGFYPDELTQPIDEELTFLFTGGRTYNPAVMYDRSYLPGKTDIVLGARSASSEAYLSDLTDASMQPAYASVEVEIESTEVIISGKIVAGPMTEDGKSYLSAYLVEDDITPSIQYLPQSGVTYGADPTAPEDMIESFRHNGVIRANLCGVMTGDAIDIDADGNFTMTYQMPDFDERWNADNLHVVAFVHRYDATDSTDCFVLNSADSKPYAPAGVKTTSSGGDALDVVVGRDGNIIVLTPVKSVKAYAADGKEVNPGNPLPKGLYIVKAVLPNGTEAGRKVMI